MYHKDGVGVGIQIITNTKVLMFPHRWTRAPSGSTAKCVVWRGHKRQAPTQASGRAHERCCLPLLRCGRVVALCSPHVVCCLSSAIFAKKTGELLFTKLPCGSKCKDGLVSKLLLRRSLCFSIDGHAHPAAARQKCVVWWGDQ